MSHVITNDCIGCHLCAKNCPANAIAGELKAIHKIDDNLCIDCGLCGKVCPKGAIIDASGKKLRKVPKSEWDKPTINSQNCAGCSVCVENCPSGCLEISAPAFRGDIRTIAVLKDSDKCIGCHICAKVCPIDAITF